MFGKVFLLLLCCIASVEAADPTTKFCADNSVTPAVSLACDGPICQNAVNGSLLPVATVCDNELSDATCQLLFPCDPNATGIPVGSDANRVCDPEVKFPPPSPITADDWPWVRSPACSRPELRDTALQCAKQCAMCCETPEYNCEDDNNSPIICAQNINKCKDSNWINLMATYCPQTCGLCTSGTCTDLSSGCSTMTALCRNIDWIDYMTTNCARTCGTCSTSSTTTTTTTTTTTNPGSSCSNIASNCAENAGLCTNSVYRSLMLQQCCATCSGTSGGSTCTDSSTSCSNWVNNGFCSSSFYTTAQKQQYCARTCNLC